MPYDRRVGYRWVEVDRRNAEADSILDTFRANREGLEAAKHIPAYSQVPTRVLVALFEAANAVNLDHNLALPKDKSIALAGAVGRARVYLPTDHPDHA